MMVIKTIKTLPSNTEVTQALPEWVVESCTKQSNVLEIGAGEGKFGYPARIRSQVGTLVGIDPDEAIINNPYLDQKFQLDAESFAKVTQNEIFDCIYSCFVAEHVERPMEYLSACRRLLKPGGSVISLTCNLWHWFGISAMVADKLGVQDEILSRLRGAKTVADYHFATIYKLNSTRSVLKLAAQAGFTQVEFRMFETPIRISGYLPKLLHWFPSLWSKLVYSLNYPQFMGQMMWKLS